MFYLVVLSIVCTLVIIFKVVDKVMIEVINLIK